MKRVDFDASSWSWTCSLCQKQKALLESCCKDCGSKRREKVVCFVRHGEAEHNVRKKRGLDEPKVRDPSLTPRGVEQAQTLRAHLETVLPQFDVAVVSPLRRALQTAHELKLEKVVISHLHAERNPQGSPSDTGSEKADLKVLFPAWEFDHLPNEWWGTVVSDHDWKTRRVQDFLHFLWTCPFDSILVVGHACFLKQLLHGDKPKKMLGNCEGVITIMKNGKLKVIKEIKPDHN